MEFIQINTGLLVGGAGLVVTAILLAVLLRARITNPTLIDIRAALLPYVFRAILAAEQIARQAMEQANESLESADKKAIADSVYALLPDVILIKGVPLPLALVKRFITREAFESLVKDIYDEAKAFIERNKSFLRAQVDGLVPDQIEYVAGSKTREG